MAEVDITPLIESFYEFFTSQYKEKINRLLLKYPTEKSLNVDFNDLDRYDPELADKLTEDPDPAILAAKESIKTMNLSIPSGIGPFAPNVRFFNLPDSEMLIENLRSKNLGTFIGFKGVVTRRADVMHKVKIATYKCSICDSMHKFHVGKNFKPQKRCPACKKLGLEANAEESKFTDIQRAEVQELLERVRGGTPATRIELWLEDDLVNSVAPGDNIEVSGVLRLKAPQNMRSKQELVYGRYVDVSYIKSLQKDFEEIEITSEDEKRILELAARPDVENLIYSSVAPAIYGYDEVKKSIALQLFGGTKGKLMKGGVPIRNDIHILLIGDPGIAKSRFLQSSTMLAPKSIYVSGKSVSGVGLTVSAEKDELGDGGWTLKAGALVLASGGCAGLDEFDKIDDEDRASLHEVMESQTVSIAKAGMVAKFRAKTAILAAANPKYGRFDQIKNLGDQFDIPPSLLSRFDLIFPIVDVLDEEKDSKLADHILLTHMHAGKDEIEKMETEEMIEPLLLRKYIAYARRNFRPVLSSEAKDMIKEFYVELRRMGKDAGSVTITPRYLEGLVRLAEANAKLRLSDMVEARDAEVSVNLMKYVLSKVMTDKETGRIDIDIVTTGRSRTQTERLQKVDAVKDIILEHMKKYDSADIETVIEDATNYEIDEKTSRRIIEELLKKGELYEKEPGHVRLVNARR
ncbi:minichromosome maintenance protein MCM [Candidatus Micrarchaeota archaeon]|nr:minichromosome maintenance protein MCM [Candidatus Micrarchaeota archaeon]